MTMMGRGVLGAIVGAVIGFALYKFVGCRTGACPLTANPFVAMAIWGAIGVMLALGK